jgi:hypothetical protein
MRLLAVLPFVVALLHAQSPRSLASTPSLAARATEFIAAAPSPQRSARSAILAQVSTPDEPALSRATSFNGVYHYGDSAPGCDHLYVSGNLWERIDIGDIAIAASARDNGEKLIVSLFVSNNGREPIDVLPNRVSAALVRPKTLALHLADPANIAKSIQRRARWASAFEQLGANMQRDQVQTQANTSGQVNVNSDYYGRSGQQVGRGEGRGTYNEQTTITTTMPNWVAQQQARENSLRRMTNANDTVQTIVVRSLKAQTLAAGEVVLGDVYFDRDRALGKPHAIEIRVAVGNSVFQFTFTRQ